MAPKAMCMRRRGKGAGRRRRAGCVRRQREVTFYKRAGHPNVRSSLSRLRDARGGERSFSAQSSERLTGLLLFAWLYLGVEMSVFWLNIDNIPIENAIERAACAHMFFVTRCLNGIFSALPSSLLTMRLSCFAYATAALTSATRCRD